MSRYIGRASNPQCDTYIFQEVPIGLREQEARHATATHVERKREREREREREKERETFLFACHGNFARMRKPVQHRC